jgi:hypothetical protein
VALRRYSQTQYPVTLGTVSGPTLLPVPTDGSSVPWTAVLAGVGPTDVCSL